MHCISKRIRKLQHGNKKRLIETISYKNTYLTYNLHVTITPVQIISKQIEKYLTQTINDCYFRLDGRSFHHRRHHQRQVLSEFCAKNLAHSGPG